MQLNLGNIERIETPSEDDIRHYLKFMPVESPFVILSNDRDEFIQAIYNGEEFHVEYSLDNGVNQFYALVDYETTCNLFLDFSLGQCDYQIAVNWNILKTPGLLSKLNRLLNADISLTSLLTQRITG